MTQRLRYQTDLTVIFQTRVREAARCPSFGFRRYEEQIWAEVTWAGDGRRPPCPAFTLPTGRN